MKNDVRPLRVLLKAIFLFVLANVVFALVNPPVGKLTLYNYIVPGRVRFPYEKEPSYYRVGYNAPIYEDFDAMFSSHAISERKPAGEFRLILLGDSATWGVSVAADETLSEQINRLHIQTCDGRTVRVYNLGYPMSFPTRDVLILDKAMEYQPDMVFWLITLSTLQPKTAETYFVALHAEQYLQLANTYDLKSPHFSGPIQKPSFWERTIVAQRKRLKNIILTQAFGILWAATGIDNHVGLEPEEISPLNPDVSDDLHYDGQLPGEETGIFDSLMLNTLLTGMRVAKGTPVVLVNEPILVVEGKNHLVRYNDFYPRWIFDEYRQFMSTWTKDQDQTWLDYGTALSPKDFVDDWHRNSLGEKHFAELLTPAIKNLACP